MLGLDPRWVKSKSICLLTLSIFSPLLLTTCRRSTPLSNMPTVSWKLPPPIHGDNSTTSANNRNPPPLTRDSSMQKTPTDWNVHSEFDDNNPFDDDNYDDSTTPADHWKDPESTLGDSSTKKISTNWTVRSSFDDDDDDDNSTTPANNWKVPPSTLGSTEETPTGWKVRSLFNGNSKKATPADNQKLPPLIEDDGSSRTSPADNPEVPPPVPPLIPPPIDDSNAIKTIPTYTPYLQLPHLLSLAWVTYPVISLIFVVFRLQLSLASAENGLENVKKDLLASCTAAEKAATAAASLPRYLAETSNQQFADAANGVMIAAKSALILSLSVLEGTLNFVIDMYRSTFFCLFELAVGIGFSLVTDAVQAVCNSSLFLSYTNASLAQHICCKHRKKSRK